MNNSFSPLTNNVLYCIHNGLLEDPVGQGMMRIYEAGVCDSTISSMFEKRVVKHKYQQAFYGTPFKKPKLSEGNYIVGLDENEKKLFSFMQFLNAHTLSVAGSGSGKTTYSYFKILQLASHLKGMWLFDLRKDEFSILKPYLARLGVHLIILPRRLIHFNPLQLPYGVCIADWTPRIADMLVDVLELPPRASKLVQSKLFILYQIFDFEKNRYPTLYDLFEAIKKDKEANHQARRSILDSLEPILRSLGPKVLAWRLGWSSHSLADKHLAFKFSGFSETDKNLILNGLLLSEFTSRISRGISNPQMDLWACIDEAQRLCSTTRNTSAIADQIGLVRGTGIGLDLSFQSAVRIQPAIISNTATKVLGRCGSINDYNLAGHSMGLNSEQIQWCQMNLKPGTFIGQFGEGSWRYPFVFRVPPMTLAKHTADSEIDISALSNLEKVYASEFDKWSTEPVEISCDPIKRPFDSLQEFSFCKAVVDHPMQPSSTYPKYAGISSKSAKQIREHLILKGYIRQNVVESGGRGRSTLLLEALPEGITAVHQYKEII